MRQVAWEPLARAAKDADVKSQGKRVCGIGIRGERGRRSGGGWWGGVVAASLGGRGGWWQVGL